MKTIIIIQARMGSSRLSGKVLKKLGDSVVLDYVVSRCKKVDCVDEVVVATSVLPQDNGIEQWCNENNITCFRGSETDVLSRYYNCAKGFNPDYVIRVTADCPFVDYELGSNIVKAMIEKPSDVAVVNEVGLPRGIVMEMVSFKTLEHMYNFGHEERHREHVTYYAKEYIKKFSQTYIDIPAELNHPELRITLDTEEDYELCLAISEYFGGDKLVSSEKVVNYLLQHPEVARINAHIEQKPVV